MGIVTIGRRFYDDHVERDLPAPPPIQSSERSYVIDADHPDAEELLNDAEHYADPGQFDWNDYRGLIMSARATAKSLRRARTKPAGDLLKRTARDLGLY